jgi:hypothetical protein
MDLFEQGVEWFDTQLYDFETWVSEHLPPEVSVTAGGLNVLQDSQNAVQDGIREALLRLVAVTDDVRHYFEQCVMPLVAPEHWGEMERFLHTHHQTTEGLIDDLQRHHTALAERYQGEPSVQLQQTVQRLVADLGMTQEHVWSSRQRHAEMGGHVTGAVGKQDELKPETMIAALAFISIPATMGSDLPESGIGGALAAWRASAVSWVLANEVELLWTAFAGLSVTAAALWEINYPDQVRFLEDEIALAIGDMIILVAENVKDSGIMQEVHAVFPDGIVTEEMCLFLKGLYQAARRVKDNKRAQKIKSTAKGLDCVHHHVVF